MSLNPIELDYEAIYLACVTHTFSSITWIDLSLDYGTSSHPFSRIFSSDENIMEIMMPNNVSWDDHHHHSSLPDSVEYNLNDLYLPNAFQSFTNSISIHEVNSKRISRISKRRYLLISMLN